MSPGSSTLHKKRSFKHKRSKAKSKAKRSTTRGQRRGRTSPKRISRKGTRTEPSPRPLGYRHEEVRAYRGEPLNVSCLDLSEQNLSQQTEEEVKNYEKAIRDALETIETKKKSQEQKRREEDTRKRQQQQQQEEKNKRDEKLNAYKVNNQVHKKTFLEYIKSVLSVVNDKIVNITTKSQIYSDLNEILESAKEYARILHPKQTDFNIDQVAWILFGLVLSLPLSNHGQNINVKIGEDNYPDGKGGFDKTEYFEDVTPLLDEIMMASRRNPFKQETIEYLVNDKLFNSELIEENSQMLSKLQVYPFDSEEWKFFLENFNSVKNEILHEMFQKKSMEEQNFEAYNACNAQNEQHKQTGQRQEDCGKLFNFSTMDLENYEKWKKKMEEEKQNVKP